MQLARIFTDLVPEILLKVLTHHITLNKAFQDKFGKKPWDGDQDKHWEWLADTMKENPRVKDFSCAAVRKNHAAALDVTNLSAALSAVMEPSDVPCGVDVAQAYSKKNEPIDYFKADVSASKRTDCKTWEGFSINVTGPSPPEVVECIVTETLSDTRVVAVGRKRAKDRDLPKKIKNDMPTKS